jgi:hypothetical protein
LRLFLSDTNNLKNKKIRLLLLLFVSSLLISQEKEEKYPQDVNKKHEVKLNSFILLAFSQFEASYEYLINNESSFGIAALVGFGDNDFSQDRRFSLAPYYRRYFSNKYARGFFIEGFGMLHTHRDYNGFYDANTYIEVNDNITGVSLGISVGGKFVSKKGFTTEINIGIGRSIGNNNSVEAVARGGISLGYRF